MAGRDGITRRGLIGSAAGLALGAGLAPAAAGEGPAKVMILRHAEKPRGDDPPYGLDADGRRDPRGLTTRGWARAGALARLFVPRDGAAPPAGLARPTFLFAAAPTAEHPSLRSGLTLSPLAALAGLDVEGSFGPDHEAEAAAAIGRRDGVGLVAWEHKRIGDLVAAVSGGQLAGPHWPGRRFDVVLVLDREGARWRLSQVPQLLLAGDGVEPLRAAKG